VNGGQEGKVTTLTSVSYIKNSNLLDTLMRLPITLFGIVHIGQNKFFF
jgi:hypothetical protein